MGEFWATRRTETAVTCVLDKHESSSRLCDLTAQRVECDRVKTCGLRWSEHVFSLFLYPMGKTSLDSLKTRATISANIINPKTTSQNLLKPWGPITMAGTRSSVRERKPVLVSVA